MPTILDVLVVQLTEEHADNKERTRMLMRIAIPTSIAFAAGPYLAVQLLYLLNPGLEWVQSMCGWLHLATVLPILMIALPEMNSREG